MSIDYNILFAYVVGIIFLLIFIRMFAMPIKIIRKLFFNTLLGGALLLIINFFGGFFGFKLAVNVFSALIAGFLGLPGLILLIILKLLFNV